MDDDYVCVKGIRYPISEKHIDLMENDGIFDVHRKRVGVGEQYYFFNSVGEVWPAYDKDTEIDRKRFTVGNYFTSIGTAEIWAISELLTRLLWIDSNECTKRLEEKGYDMIDKDYYDDDEDFYAILYNRGSGRFKVYGTTGSIANSVYWLKYADAERAIHNIVMPFVEQYGLRIWKGIGCFD